MAVKRMQGGQMVKENIDVKPNPFNDNRESREKTWRI